MLAITGPLVGVSFIRAVSTYSEISEGAGTCGRNRSPKFAIVIEEGSPPGVARDGFERWN